MIIPADLKKMTIVIALILITLLSCREIQVIKEVISTTQKLSERKQPIELISMTVDNPFLCSLEELKQLNIGFYINNRTSLKFTITDNHDRYSASVKKQKEYQGFYRIKDFTTSLLKENGIEPTAFRVLIENNENRPVYFPSIIYCEKRIPRQFSLLIFWFRRNGILPTQRFQIVDHANKIVFEKELQPAKAEVKIEWNGRNLSGVLVNPGQYSFIVTDQGNNENVHKSFDFYLPNYENILDK